MRSSSLAKGRLPVATSLAERSPVRGGSGPNKSAAGRGARCAARLPRTLNGATPGRAVELTALLPLEA